MGSGREQSGAQVTAGPATIVSLGVEHVERLLRLFDALPEGDMTFIKENVDRDSAASWVQGRGCRWVALDGDGAVIGIVAVLPLLGWSDHVGEIRLVVHPDRRGEGIGRALARHALREAVDMGLSKLLVEVVAQQESAVAMFTALGFEGEALLRDQIRDRSGKPGDLLMLAHFVQDTRSAIASMGVEDELGPDSSAHTAGESR
jgi:ribosomal protein S18 acetylase RimI-like enzyme